MTNELEARKVALVNDIARLAGGSDPDGMGRFIERYFAGVDGEDLALREAAAWRDAALGHLEFARRYRPGAPAIRVFNPEGGSTTVIELLNADMPFLVDSVNMELHRQGCAIDLVIHPLYGVIRDGDGVLAATGDPDGGPVESWIHVEIARISDAGRRQAIHDGLAAVLVDVYAAVADWAPMTDKVREVLAGMGAAARVVPLEIIDEVRAFLGWLADNHFTFLGYARYDLHATQLGAALTPVDGTCLGLLRHQPAACDLCAAPSGGAPQLMLLTKSSSRSTVHRPGQLDEIGVRLFGADGSVQGEHRFVGLYTSTTYHANPADVPLLRQKVAAVEARSGFAPKSHAGKNLHAVLETLPRDELLQMDADELFATVMGIVRLGERSRTRLFVRRDSYGRFYSCLIYLPREAYNTELRVRLQHILKQALHGREVDFNVQLSESVLARVHMLVHVDPGASVVTDFAAIETAVVAATRRWEEGVLARIADTQGDEVADAVRRELVLPLPAAYREDVGVDQAVEDVRIVRALDEASPLAVSLYRAGGGGLRFRTYRVGADMPLSVSLPMLENAGVTVLGEQSYEIGRHHAPKVHIHDFELAHGWGDVDLTRIKPLFEEAFTRISRGAVENDGFNRLTLAAALASDEIVVLRTLAKYLKQTGFTYSQGYIEQILAKHAGITQGLVHLFHARFDPARDAGRADAVAAAAAGVEQALEAVASADEDKVLRRLLAVIQAALRTNYYQVVDGARKDYLSIKFESAKVPDLPAPRPLYEIFVYSPRVEGIHLRGGKVARGGLRWSDRPEDFRTEVLGLVKAQMVKNAVIVPVGSKGGFVVKTPTPAGDRDAWMAEGIACYRTFLRGLLDLTDNLVKGKVVVRDRLVRHDGDDPYLVVAADKGTATFSDYANAISAEYGHWLGDAFASGGSVGYDHKKMGITARGAWESVKRHFRETGVDTQTTDFTVAGVGDMSGDVFGNGMLLSKHIRLVAAFDHRHIFLDPDPDAAKSFVERERLFKLPRSSWEDYDKSLISAGGGVYPRGAKSIPLSPEVRRRLDVTAEAMTPVELMSAILKAPVDLFYNGGIGTYVKASTQSHASVGDRANDALRVDGRELRCKVVAEGGNLGCTQLGRVEFAQAGGRINTDAIDNSAGVDCSDHEVNIKILLNAVVEAGGLDVPGRDALLAQMTDEVGLQVLEDNYYQTQSLSVSGMRAERMLDAQQRFIRALEKSGRLDRKVEYLPGDEDIAERKARKQGLTTPERAVLLSYSKMALYDELLASDLVDDPFYGQTLIEYFPTPLRARFAEAMQRHPLRREIIATELANATINRNGSVFIHRMREETGAGGPDVVRCYTLVREVLGVGRLMNDIDALDAVVPSRVQGEMLMDVGRLVLRAVLWFLRRRSVRMPIGEVVAYFAEGVATMRGGIDPLLAAEDRAAVHAAEARLVESGVPREVAAQVARLDAMYAVLDIVELARETQRDVPLAAATYFAVSGALDARWVASQIGLLPADTHWQGMARAAMRDDLAALQRQAAVTALRAAPPGAGAAEVLAGWQAAQATLLTRIRDVMADLRLARERDLAMLSVLLRELRLLQ